MPAAVVSCKCNSPRRAKTQICWLTNARRDLQQVETLPRKQKRRPAGRDTSQKANVWQRHSISRHKFQLHVLQKRSSHQKKRFHADRRTKVCELRPSTRPKNFHVVGLLCCTSFQRVCVLFGLKGVYGSTNRISLPSTVNRVNYAVFANTMRTTAAELTANYSFCKLAKFFDRNVWWECRF